jgi:DNA (cytosine-5)-methyltransferase 1
MSKGTKSSSKVRGHGEQSAPLLDLMARKAVQKEPARVPTRSLRTVGLFAGIGGIELGLHRAGHRTSLLCEIEEGARAVLSERFPDVPQHDDIRTLDEFPSGTELVVGGFPCQDLSQAGKTAGITGARSGLVGEVFRILEKRRVPWLLLENVPFMLQLSRGRALEVIVGQLEELGYRWAYRVVDSRAFGVPQRRERVYLVASLDEDPRGVLLCDDVGEPAPVADYRKYACGFYWTEGLRGLGWAVDAVPTLKGGSTIGIPSQPAILMPGGDIVKPDIRDAERMQGFEVDWTLPAEKVTKRGHRWKLVGNAVTVDVAQWIGERLATPRQYEPSTDALLLKGSPWPRAAWGDGKKRFVSPVSRWPVQKRGLPLHKFLCYPTTPLSVKATAGFLSRTQVATLRFPDGFIDAVKAHLAKMEMLLSA